MSNGRLTSGSSSTRWVQEGTTNLLCVHTRQYTVDRSGLVAQYQVSQPLSQRQQEEWKLAVVVGLWIQKKVRGLGQRRTRTERIIDGAKGGSPTTDDYTRTLVSGRGTRKYHAYPRANRPISAAERQLKGARYRYVWFASGPLAVDRQVHAYIQYMLFCRVH